MPCEGGVPALSRDEARQMLSELSGWQLEEGNQRLRRELTFEDFVALMVFVTRMAELAEAEGHHPDFCVHYNRLEITLWTHAVGGLSENDFILAAKIDTLYD